MDVLDLFSGLEGWSKAYEDRGHKVTTFDINPKFNPDRIGDILDVENIDQLGSFDVVLASPPCETFSLSAGFMHYWKINKKEGTAYPNSAKAEKALKIASHTFRLLEQYNPTFYVIENPRGYMRKVFGKPKAEITQCQYGRKWQKATDLWGKLPPSFMAKKCKNGSTCHIASGHPAGEFSKASLRKKLTTPADRAEIPYGLSLAMCKAMEKDLGG